MRKWELARGFTLLELIITLSVLAVLFISAMPAFKSITERAQVEQLTTELTGFFQYARSEAVLRNKDLYVHITFPQGISHSVPNWSMTLTDSDVTGAGTTISQLSGNAFTSISVFHTYSSDQISFDGVRGRAKSGTFKLFPTNDTTKQIELRTSNPPGRIKVCGAEGDLYGYKEC
ncbi:GspH/FimT family pseudopilin [Vibrio renipiscarius]|uniref:GspH/FimT family pseudopilin n=1 Tax=Vibrio renipiscarius TaxID=1461322 RepID=UPI003552F458